jgi:hypothetical protein
VGISKLQQEQGKYSDGGLLSFYIAELISSIKGKHATCIFSLNVAVVDAK